jgi:hypothetical protein
MKVLETRRMNECMRFRRYRKENGRTTKTMEIPWSLWLRVKSSVMPGVPGFIKAEAARDRIAVVEELLRAGNKSEWIADVTGLTGQRVRQIKARMKPEIDIFRRRAS